MKQLRGTCERLSGAAECLFANVAEHGYMGASPGLISGTAPAVESSVIGLPLYLRMMMKSDRVPKDSLRDLFEWSVCRAGVLSRLYGKTA